MCGKKTWLSPGTKLGPLALAASAWTIEQLPSTAKSCFPYLLIN